MPTFGKKKNFTDWLYTTPTVVVLSVLVLLMVAAVIERYGVEREMYERQVKAEQERQEVLERQENLEQEVEYLEGERGIEAEIRKNFDVAREGETVVILTGDSQVEQEVEVPTDTESPRWYEFWR